MQSAPEFDPFRRIYEAGQPQVVWTTLVADLETPVSAMLKLTDGRPNSFLFESVQGGATRGRYSFIGLKPDLIWRCRNGKAEINRRARLDSGKFEPCSERCAAVAARAGEGMPDGNAVVLAAHGCRPVRLSGL